MLAPEGYIFIDCDSSQIEARTLAWLAGQNDLVTAFDQGEDVYRIMASRIYGVPAEEVTDDQRFVGKTTILGCGYGMGAEKFKAQLLTFGVDMKLGECRRIINIYRDTYPSITKLWQKASDALDAMANGQTAPLGLANVLTVCGADGIKLPNGLSLKYPKLRWIYKDNSRPEMVYNQKKGKAVISTRIYGGKLIENVCQALARIIIGEQMLMIARSYHVVMTVHDAVGVIAPIEKEEEAQRFVEACMRMRPKWATGLPLNCESKKGASYGG
jgi:DNA polymerase